MQKDYTSNTPVVYVIHAQGTPLVKIGTAMNSSLRLQSIQTGCPHKCVILATWPGGRELESHLHSVMAEYRRSGEWFALPAFFGKRLFDAVEEFNRKDKVKLSIKSRRRPRACRARDRRNAVATINDTMIHFDAVKWKASRYRPGFLFRRIPGYKIVEDNYGVTYLGVISWRPDRTSSDIRQFPHAGRRSWDQLIKTGDLVMAGKEK